MAIYPPVYESKWSIGLRSNRLRPDDTKSYVIRLPDEQYHVTEGLRHNDLDYNTFKLSEHSANPGLGVFSPRTNKLHSRFR